MNPRTSIWSVCLVAALLLTGCDALQLGVETATATVAGPAATVAASATLPTVAETPAPSQTGPAAPTRPAAPSEQALASMTPNEHSTVAPVDTASGSPTAVLTPINPTVIAGQPQVTESILLLTPGNGGGVTSPVRVSGEADPTFEQTLVIKITDAEGKVLVTQPTTIQGVGAVRGPFDDQVPFTVTVDTPGRISVYTTSARDGGLIHLASADVTLLSACCSEPVVGQLHNETHIIQEPAPQATVTGGHLHVSGFSDYVLESQLALALCGEGGTGTPDEVCGTADNVLATGTAMLNAPDVGQPGPFAGDLAYTVSAPVAGRLVVFSRSARDGGILHLSTVPVTLMP